MEGRRALDAALDLAQMPTLANAMRLQPLPPDTLVVIRIAAGCTETAVEAVNLTGRPLEKIREAAALYLQMVLLAPDSDSYRVLGVRPGTQRSKMREHMRWLLLWLHPDRNGNEWESVFAERVTRAWRDAAASSRREGQEKLHRLTTIPSPGEKEYVAAAANRWIRVPIKSSRSSSYSRWGVIALVMGALVLAISSVRMIPPIQKWIAATSVAKEDAPPAN